MKKRWIIATRRVNFTPSTSTRICSKHFKLTDYDNHFGKISLKKGAVPSLFDFPKHLQKRLATRKTRKSLIEQKNEVELEQQQAHARFVPIKFLFIPLNCL